MIVRKHVAGLALFTLIVSVTILISNFLKYPNAAVPEVGIDLPFSVQPTAAAVDYKVRLVSLDFIAKQSFTSLTLTRRQGEAAPQSLWVTTHFFSPEVPGRVWANRAVVHQPFANGDRLDYVASGSCEFCSAPGTPKAGYFARVTISTDSPGQVIPTADTFDSDITTAERVVVQRERKPVPSVVR